LVGKGGRGKLAKWHNRGVSSEGGRDGCSVEAQKREGKGGKGERGITMFTARKQKRRTREPCIRIS